MAIGIYDSGIGGLTVYKAIAAKFKNLDMIYLGDSARVPYGNKSPETIIKYSLECSKYLTSRYNISALIVACNTISSHALHILHKELNIPILGVIIPGAKNAVDVSKNKNIGVVATHATVNSQSYVNTISNIDENCSVYQQACPLFVPLVEEAFVNGEMVEIVVRESLKDISKTNIDTLILGCTHYPVLKPVIEKIMPKVKVVDSTEYIINDIINLNIKLDEKGFRHILITDESHAFHSLKKLLVGDISVEIVEVGS